MVGSTLEQAQELDYSTLDLSNPCVLLETLQKLRQIVVQDGQDMFYLLHQQIEDVLGQTTAERQVRIMVTLPTEAASDGATLCGICFSEAPTVSRLTEHHPRKFKRE